MADDQLEVPGVPFALVPAPAAAWRTDGGTVGGSAAPHSDLFVDPGAGTTLNAESLLNAATLLGLPPEGDFQFSARVSVGFAATYDAGVLLLWAGERRWAKLCFEFSPDGEPMVVSVVTRGVSDDANAFVVAGRSVWLRVSRVDRAFAYHASTDGSSWRFIRFFSLDEGSVPVRLGFEAQSPTGDGCPVTFDEIRFVTGRLADLRDGT
jgi:uncharacterized protein